MCRKNFLEEGADSITGKLLIHDNWQRTSRHFHYCILSRSKPGIPHIFISTRVFDLLHFLFKNLTQPETWLICKRQLLNFYYIILMAQSTKSNFIKHTQIERSFNWLGWEIFQFDLLATGDYLFILATSRIRIGAISWWPTFDLLLPGRIPRKSLVSVGKVVFLGRNCFLKSSLQVVCTKSNNTS